MFANVSNDASHHAYTQKDGYIILAVGCTNTLPQIATTALCLFSLLSTVSAVNTIEVQGQDFVDSVTKDRFVIIGVDYQPGEFPVRQISTIFDISARLTS